MSESLSHSLLMVALWIAVALVLLAAAIAGLRKWRGDAAHNQPTASELLTKFRELHARGGLSDDEYRTIKAKLATELEPELKDNDQST
jgi:uncharacterized membrane protein